MSSLRDKYAQYHPRSRAEWRQWLQHNYASSPGIWLVYYKKETRKPRVEYNDAVEEALCFGWIDSTQLPLDHERYMGLFTPRKPKSNWSKSNKERVERLIEQKLMTPAGLAKIEIAKQNGSWSALDDAENLVVPAELQRALKRTKGALAGFRAFRPGVQKQLLFWLAAAKRPETRAKRTAAIAEAAAAGRNPLA